MNRIKKLFASGKKDILNIYFTAGYPNLNDTTTIIQTLSDQGVDLIEVGMPYSDPLADGPTIQESGSKAIENGMTVDVLFDQLTEVRQHTDVPLVLMGYFNQVLQYGDERFFARAAEVGVDGLILPDLPVLEFEQFYGELAKKYNLSITFLITPQTPEARIHKIDSLTDGFIYMVSNSSITGAKSGISDAQVAYFNRINQMELKNPRLIGFGISNHETFSKACEYADGAIIGSAFIRALSNGKPVAEAAEAFVKGVRGV